MYETINFLNIKFLHGLKKSCFWKRVYGVPGQGDLQFYIFTYTVALNIVQISLPLVSN